jgi:hypothetical protein
MLPEQGPEIAVCGAYDWDARKRVRLVWRGLIRRLQVPFKVGTAKTDGETRLARMVLAVQREAYAGRTDPMLIQRLEAQLAATDDRELRRIFARYLSEP